MSAPTDDWLRAFKAANYLVETHADVVEAMATELLAARKRIADLEAHIASRSSDLRMALDEEIGLRTRAIDNLLTATTRIADLEALVASLRAARKRATLDGDNLG
jgi:hypothetical protein